MAEGVCAVMIDADYALSMARYNRWQNRSLYAAADMLDPAARTAPRGAFFGSIQGTLNHLLWADQTWMVRFADMPPPRVASIRESVDLYQDWAELCAARASFDEALIVWAEGLKPSDLAGDLTWFSGSAGRTMTKPRALLILHMFNHQTHHRGQVHAMLTQAGATPGVTDIWVMPEA